MNEVKVLNQKGEAGYLLIAPHPLGEKITTLAVGRLMRLYF